MRGSSPRKTTWVDCLRVPASNLIGLMVKGGSTMHRRPAQPGDELADQFRVAEDPGGRRQEDGARKSLAQMPGLRADAVLSRARSQSSRMPQLRPSFPDRRRSALEVAVRRRRLYPHRI